MYKIIALDIGGVCISLHFERALKSLGYSCFDQIPIEFLAATNMLEKGKIETSDWLNIFQEATNNSFPDKELRKAWGMIIGEAIEGMPELAKELVDAGYKLVFFSDTSEIHMQEVYRNLSFANLVTGAVFSYEVGAKKPDDAMYKAFEDKYGKPVFYADDRDINIEGGNRNGWDSHLFTSADVLRKALMDNGLL
jgi:putative hydrolase of the HAD superfamily